MNFAAAIVLVMLVLYKIKSDTAKAAQGKPYHWRNWPWCYSLFLIIAIFLFICGFYNIYFWGIGGLVKEIVSSAFIILVLTIWNVICNSLKYGKVCYSVMGAILFLQICLLTYLVFYSYNETSPENIEKFRHGIAHCHQSLVAGKKDELKEKITEFNKSTGTMKSFPVFAKEFEKITASVNNGNDGVKP